ncbi:hypothetical protein IJS98_07260, partial [bacterium]|nr:hypothetical protein [bacterium]
MLRLCWLFLILFLTACEKSGSENKGGSSESGLSFTKEASLEAYAGCADLYADAPLILRFKEGTKIEQPADWKAPVFLEEIGKLDITKAEDGTVVTNAKEMAVSPTNAYLVSNLLKGNLELPLPFDGDEASLPKWEKLLNAFKQGAFSNAFHREAYARLLIKAPQSVAARFSNYDEFHEALVLERSLKTPVSQDYSVIWARTYFFLRKAIKEKRFEDVKRIALDAEAIEGDSPEWEAMMAEYLKACDPTRLREIAAHYDRAMKLYAKRSKGIPFYRVWVEKTGLEAFTSDSETVISRYYAILKSLDENENKGLIKSDFANAIREQTYISISLLLIRYDQTVNASLWAKRLFSKEFSREAKEQGISLLFKTAEKSGAIFEAIASYDKLIDEAETVEERNYWRLEKGSALMRFDLPEEAKALYADILEEDPNIENRQFALNAEDQDSRFMHLHYYVLKVSEDDMRDTALSNLRKRGILNRANSSYYLRQAAQLLVCMQRLKEAYNIYDNISKDDNTALLEYIYLLYRNSRYDQCITMLRRLPYHKGSDISRDWRFAVVRLFRAKRQRPEISKVITEYEKLTNEVTRARFCNGMGNIYQAYRDS